MRDAKDMTDASRAVLHHVRDAKDLSDASDIMSVFKTIGLISKDS
jgi:hypothetical protein